MTLHTWCLHSKCDADFFLPPHCLLLFVVSEFLWWNNAFFLFFFFFFCAIKVEESSRKSAARSANIALFIDRYGCNDRLGAAPRMPYLHLTIVWIHVRHSFNYVSCLSCVNTAWRCNVIHCNKDVSRVDDRDGSSSAVTEAHLHGVSSAWAVTTFLPFFCPLALISSSCCWNVYTYNGVTHI